MSEDVEVVSTGVVSQDGRRFVKSKLANLFILEPGGVYYGRVKVAGKNYKKSFETTSFGVAKRKLKVWLDEVRGKATNDSTLGALAEEYQTHGIDSLLQSAASVVSGMLQNLRRSSCEQLRKIRSASCSSANNSIRLRVSFCV